MRKDVLTLVGGVSVCLSLLLTSCRTPETGANSPSRSQSASQSDGQPADLPLPTSMPLRDYEKVLYTWLLKFDYKKLGWKRDKGVRDTGPFIRNEYFGTHPAVRIFYSPEVMRWLENGRQGDIPDGAMIVKEMYTAPGVLYQDLAKDPKYQADPDAYETMLGKLLTAWSVMVRDKAGSKDGWFWAGPSAAGEGQTIAEAVDSQLDNYSHAPYSSFGAPCLRCHGSAENMFTFSALRNIEGFLPEEYPLRFFVDTSWRSPDHLSSYPLSLLKDDPYAQSVFEIPELQRPWEDSEVPGLQAFLSQHMGQAELSALPMKNEALPNPNSAFLKQFPELARSVYLKVRPFPSQWADHVVPGPDGAEAFITSSNCLGCHGGLGGLPYGVTMFLQTGPNYGEGFNVSEYGEWRWSPMGLAGRDPIFHSQLESEMAYVAADGMMTPTPLKGSVADTQTAITNTCLSCHGAMGQRQLEIDAAVDPALDPNFKVDYFYLTQVLSAAEPKPEDYAYHKYGELAREGISCVVCHHINEPSAEQVSSWNPTNPGWLTPLTPKELAFGLFHNSTGRFERGPDDEYYGPFKDVSTRPMEDVLGVKPVHNGFMKDSQMCGTCHTINLPNIGMTQNPYPVLDAAETNPAFKDYSHTIEQATFLEWQNSAFAQGENDPNSDFKSCQGCHMPGGFETLDGSIDIDQLVTQVATIQDANYPAAEHTLPLEDIDIPLRPDYNRHEHVGLNVFLLEMFDQFPEILGVDKTDYMTGADNGVDLAIDNMILQAQKETVDIDVKVEGVSNGVLTANVTLTNKTGHRFPSGVAFRRAFLEFLVMDGDKVVWGSGRTNSVGVIVDGKGIPLKTEFLPSPDAYQPHYQLITQENQVQIYEELNQNAQHEFTTSFVHRVYSPKDNRLLPKGWRVSTVFKPEGQVMEQFMASTDPHGVGDDPDYQDQGPGFKGQDALTYKVTLPSGVNTGALSVKATLYYQSIPPYWLKQRFTTTPNGTATQRLYYMVSRLNLEGTQMENWKLVLKSMKVSGF
ncbi:hypothetical protein EUZ85_00370 [Hahella sp. KA22]|uniref:hypothetical protein n=1 Tax=Hahella sp. KA22 TaxID=1628392 RepID=UPI000FDE2779|nr:hypothetical protein [Hahella sp. KA22]AZZ94952.1 hypothetical protein ENC22_28660 [Hahella sp. KA22]QAY52597.1 hypothetical protein EUZ85_00370 [Hahella sp. KA22]